MLVLTRKIGEAISIGDDVKIIVMQVKGKQVRLGIKAGPKTMVHREEVYQRIQDENLIASQSSAEDLSLAAQLTENAGLSTSSLGTSQAPLRKKTKITPIDSSEDDDN